MVTLRFPYELERRAQAVWSLGGRWVRPRPILPVTIVGPKTKTTRRSQLDPGADDTVFSEALAASIGIDLSASPATSASGVGGRSSVVRFAEVQLSITDGIQTCQWPARVGFTAARLKRPLMGFAGFLQFFTATFYGDREEVELETNALYPGDVG